IGDERRVAEADANAAGLQIDYGTDRVAALKLLSNARANLERLGHVDFQIAAMQSEADSDRYLGRVGAARALLRTAFERAKDKQLTEGMNPIRVALAQADIDASRYGEAVSSLEALVQSDAGSSDVDAQLALVSVLIRLGDLSNAGVHLARATSAIEG